MVEGGRLRRGARRANLGGVERGAHPLRRSAGWRAPFPRVSPLHIYLVPTTHDYRASSSSPSSTTTPAASTATATKRGMSDPRRYDPRLGDEDEEPEHATPPPRSVRRVRIPDVIGHDAEDTSSPLGGARAEKSRAGLEEPRRTPPVSWASHIARWSPLDLSWIPANSTWSKWKPALRCAAVCFISAVLMVIPSVYTPMGQVSITSNNVSRNLSNWFSLGWVFGRLEMRGT